MNKYHYLLIAIFTIGALIPFLDKNLKPYQKWKAVKVNSLIVLIIIFLIYKSSN
jgi:hypothetical protein